MGEVELDIEVLSKRLDDRFAQVTSRTKTLHGDRVPRVLRNVNAKAYEPESVAIGPYHHGKRKLKAMEDLKLCCFYAKSHQKMNCLSEIAKLEKMARDFYAEHIDLDEAKFIEMLVLDGCFIIELIGHTTYIPTRLRNSLLHDLVLLENQIPFFVLCKLFDFFEGQDQHQLLMERVLVFFKDVFPGKILYKRCREADEVKHILDLVHSNWYPPLSNTKIVEVYDTDSEQEILVQASSSSFFIPSAVKLKDANVKFKLKKYDKDSSSSVFIPSAVPLKDANVKQFHEKKGTTLFDVEFRKNKGVVLMPALVIDDGTESLLRNLIAYEQYFSETERTPVTDYALLLDNLINNAEDVQILCRSGIIKNLLGSDEAVAKFVNQLTYKITYYGHNFMYGKIFKDINEYHKKYIYADTTVNRALAQFHRDYYKGPLTFISIVAAAAHCSSNCLCCTAIPTPI